ncbi:MAG: S8 family serine peptidase, partial [bacterium]
TEIDAKAVFSNYGYFIDISAPGAGENVSSPFYHRNILSLRAASTGDENLIVDSQYLRNAGTSMAAPHVAGAAAMILANQPSLTTEQVRQALKKGSDDILSAGYDKYSGAGRLNLHKALQINQPLEVVMTSPKEQSFFDVKNIEIKGTINGEGFLDWTLDYGIGENPTQWVSIASSSLPVIDDVLAVWDISDFLIEEIVLRLRANSKSGIFEDRRGCSITNAYITSPMHTDIINANQQIDIIATIAGKVTNYSVEYGRGLYPTEWLSKGVILTGLDQGASYNNIIATIAPNTLPEEGFYSLRLRIYNNQGARDLFVKMIFADFKLKKGWPVDFPKNSLALNDAQSFAVEDINNDGFKEIVTIRNPGKDFINNPDKDYEGNFLEVYDYQGRLLWAVLLSTRINNYDDAFAIADVDNDDYKEIFVNGNNKIGEIKAFHYDGTPMDGWPVLTKLSKGPMKIIADVDCDGNKEVVAWSNSDERLYIFSKEGNEKLDLFLPSGNISSYYSSLPAIGNLDEDRELEIIITQRQGDGDDYKGTNKIFAVNPDGTEVSGWPISLGEGRILNVVTGDIDNDGKDEVVVKFENSVYVFQGNGSLFPGWPIIDEEDFFSGSGVALADFDDDGDLEITWAKNNSLGTFTIHVVHHTGIYAQGWPQTAELAGVNNIVSPTIGDVNNDGKADIVIANGGLAKTLLVNGDWTTCGGVWAWDFDGSLISLNDMADVYPLFIQKPNCWLWYLPIAPVVITDVDNNGIVDLVVSSTCVETWDLENEFSIMSKCRGEIYIWELGTSFNAEQSFW